jgi:hypothetical protein
MSKLVQISRPPAWPSEHALRLSVRSSWASMSAANKYGPRRGSGGGPVAGVVHRLCVLDLVTTIGDGCAAALHSARRRTFPGLPSPTSTWIETPQNIFQSPTLPRIYLLVHYTTRASYSCQQTISMKSQNMSITQVSESAVASLGGCENGTGPEGRATAIDGMARDSSKSAFPKKCHFGATNRPEGLTMTRHTRSRPLVNGAVLGAVFMTTLLCGSSARAEEVFGRITWVENGWSGEGMAVQLTGGTISGCPAPGNEFAVSSSHGGYKDIVELIMLAYRSQSQVRLVVSRGTCLIGSRTSITAVRVLW